jgi:2-dehydropantoate 2-reductase
MAEGNQFAPILVVGAGAVGGYIAAHLARAGERIAVLEPWAPNREAIAAHGLTVEDPDETFTARMPTMADAREIAALAPGLVILCTKLADAPQAVAAIEAVYRGPYLVTLNALADQSVASQTGVARIAGCIVTGLFGRLTAPGRLQRLRRRFDGGPATFLVGEATGPATPRIATLVAMLRQVDRAEPVEDMAAARWTKLVFNAMTSPLSALESCPTRRLFTEPALRARLTALALETVVVAQAAGLSPGTIAGVPGPVWAAAARGDAAARATLDAGLVGYGEKLSPDAISGMAQDRARGRRTEVTLINGLVVEEARRRGLEAPANALVVAQLEAATAATG